MCAEQLRCQRQQGSTFADWDHSGLGIRIRQTVTRAEHSHSPRDAITRFACQVRKGVPTRYDREGIAVL